MARMDISKARIGWLASVATLLMAPAFAQADETARYIEARDQAIQELKGKEGSNSPKYDELETQLRKLLGPFRREGFSGKSSFNLSDLTGGFGFGRIDGLEYTSKDERTVVLVTTRVLVTDWLAKYYETSKQDKVTLDALLSREPARLLTWGWGIEDQHFTLFQPLPVEKPKNTTTTEAFLGHLTADDANYIPRSIIAVIAPAGRVYFVSQRLTTPLPAFEECDRRWQTLWESKRADFEDAASAAFNKCYVAHVASTPELAAARKQAQDLIESFAR